MLAQPEFRRSIAAAAFLFALANIAEAGPPFVTDDPEPPPPGGWEINVPFIIERAASGTEMNAPLFDLNYGLLPNAQLQFQAPIKIVQRESDQAAGLGDPLLGLKWRFLSDEKSQVQLGVYPQVLLPVGDHRRDLDEGPGGLSPAVPGSKRLGEMDALRRGWILVANGARTMQLLVRRIGPGARTKRAIDAWSRAIRQYAARARWPRRDSIQCRRRVEAERAYQSAVRCRP
jgi:Putative MetA-pathway of phenol degradation